MFDISVDGEHEFFANGVLVSNSTDTLIYGRKLIAHLFDTGTVEHEATPAPVYVDPMGLDAGGEDPPDEFADLLSDPGYQDSWGNG